jgi:GGDEF domain-containing protein
MTLLLFTEAISLNPFESYFKSMPAIEFRNNGSKDSLTGAPTVSLFIEYLEREVALRARLKEPLSVLMISIPRARDGYEIFLLNQGIRSILRKEDFYCRASEDGFWIAMRSNALGAKKAGERFEISLKETFRRDQIFHKSEDQIAHKPPHIKIDFLEYRAGTKSGDWVKEIDRCYFAY